VAAGFAAVALAGIRLPRLSAAWLRSPLARRSPVL